MGDWGLGNFVIFIIIFIIMILIVIYNVSKLDFSAAGNDDIDTTDIDEVDTNTSNTTAYSYSDLETKVNGAAKTYITKYYPNLSTGDQFVIKISSLVIEGMITTPVAIDNASTKCSGYVTVYKEEIVTYKTYLKCGNSYTTSGYQTRYDE